MHFLLKTVAFVGALWCCASAIESSWLTDLRGENSGHTTCPFLSLPVSANVLARGLASAPGAMDATDVAFFPSQTALSERNQFAITHLQWMMGLRKEFAAASLPILDIGTIGFFSQVFSAGRFNYARDINEQPSNPSMLEYAIGMSAARAFFNRKLSVGLNGSFVGSQLDDAVGQAGSGGADILYSPFDQLSSRLYLVNYGTINYGSRKEDLPVQAGLSARYFPLRPELPITSTMNFDIAAGVYKIADEPLTAGASTEWEIKQYFRARAGYEYALGSQVSVAGLGVGGGYHRDMYGIDAAWRYQSPELGSVWAATIKVQLEEIVPRSAESYYELALRHYRKSRYGMCVHYARKALKLDPNMWKAHALISRTRSDILRKQKLEIALIYTGNASGIFLPPPTPQSIGGIPRQATAISILRSQFPVSFSIESGNLITGLSHPLRAEIAGRYLNYIKHQAITPGPGEISFGLKRFLDEIDKESSRLVCTSLERRISSDIVEHTVLENSDYRIFLISAINPSVLPTSELRSTLRPFDSGLASKLQQGDAKRADLRIVVLHDSWENIKAFVPTIPSADIVICGHIDQRFESPMRIGSSMVLSGGKGGGYVGNLVLRFNEDRKLISAQNRFIPLTSEIQPDSTMAAMVRELSSKISLEEQGITEQDLLKGRLDGIFPFVSNRHGASGLFLKMIDKNAEFPLTSDGVESHNPAALFESGKIAYLRTDTAGHGCTSLWSMDISGANKQVLIPDKNVRESCFIPKQDWLYFIASSCGGADDKSTGIFRIRAEGGPHFPVIAWDNSAQRSLTFAPDSSLMAFSSNRSGTWQLYESNVLGEHPLQITDTIANYFSPQFSSDGARIAYLSDRSNYGGRHDIWIYDRKAAIHRPITANSNVHSFCWLPDARTIVYSSGVNIRDLNTVDVVDTRFSKLIVSDSMKTYHEQTPRALQYKGEQKVLYVRESQTGNRTIYWVNANGTGDQALVNSAGSNWLEP